MKQVKWKIKTWDDIYQLNKYVCMVHEQYHKCFYKITFHDDANLTYESFLIGLN